MESVQQLCFDFDVPNKKIPEGFELSTCSICGKSYLFNKRPHKENEPMSFGFQCSRECWIKSIYKNFHHDKWMFQNMLEIYEIKKYELYDLGLEG